MLVNGRICIIYFGYDPMMWKESGEGRRGNGDAVGAFCNTCTARGLGV